MSRPGHRDVAVSSVDTRKPERWAVVSTGVTLFVGTLIVLLSTLDMGFTRDESFYFRYAESYQKWFVDVESAPDEATRHDTFGRQQVRATWTGNFEHPPLMKTVFGASWRAFGRKDRRLEVLPGDGRRVRVFAPQHHGFPVGATVAVLAPLERGMATTAPRRELARGVVSLRTQGNATIDLVGDGDLSSLRERCRVVAGAPPARTLTGCQGREVRTLAVMSESTAMRLPGIISAALAVLLTFLLGVELFGYGVGVFGALAFLFIPRNFFHAHMCCFDMPVVAASLAVLYAFWKSLSDRRWALATAVFWGVALLTKHNAFFLPVPLLLFWALSGRDRFKLVARFRVRLPPLPLALLVMPVIALPMLFVFWPQLWYDPLRALRTYFVFHLDHAHYFQWFFGEPLQVPPFPVNFPFTLTATTVPATLLFLVAAGTLYLLPPKRWGHFLRRLVSGSPVTQRERVWWFVALNAAIPIAVIALPSTPIFGGVKHWMPAMPFLMLLAGVAVVSAARALRPSPWVAAVAGVVLLVHPVKASFESVAFGTGYYNSVVAGGIQGAADRQMMRLYWGHTSLQTLGWLNDNAPRGAKVYFQNTTREAYQMYKSDGRLRHDIKWHPSVQGSVIALIEPQKSFADIDREVRRNYGVAGPDREVVYEGVPMLKVYVRPGSL